MLLVMDTSSLHCSAAIYDCEADKVVVEQCEDLGRGHAERLMPMLEELLEKTGASWEDIKRLGVVNGPGSFTGMRVGLSVARGLALALGIPCNTVTVFEAFGEAFGIQDPLCVALDARRDEVWMQSFSEGKAVSEPSAISVARLSESLPALPSRIVGSAAVIVATVSDKSEIVGEAASPPIAAVARYIAHQPPTALKPQPLYLRAPDAKPQTSIAGAQ